MSSLAPERPWEWRREAAAGPRETPGIEQGPVVNRAGSYRTTARPFHKAARFPSLCVGRVQLAALQGPPPEIGGRLDSSGRER